MKTARDIIKLWPSRLEMANDLPRATLFTVNSWATRNRIAASHDRDIVKAAKKRGLDVTFEMLADARAKASKKVAA